jgi:hypothetical protein
MRLFLARRCIERAPIRDVHNCALSACGRGPARWFNNKELVRGRAAALTQPSWLHRSSCPLRNGERARPSALQYLQHFCVQVPVACRDHAPASVRTLIVPRRYNATSTLDDRDQRQHIIRFEFGLDDEIDVAGG